MASIVARGNFGFRVFIGLSARRALAKRNLFVFCLGSETSAYRKIQQSGDLSPGEIEQGLNLQRWLAVTCHPHVSQLALDRPYSLLSSLDAWSIPSSPA